MHRAVQALSKIFAIKYLLLWLLLLIILFFSMSAPAFRDTDNLLEIGRASVTNAVLVLGLTWIVAAGEIDVSFPDIAAFSSMFTAFLVVNDVPWGVAILLALLASSLFGFLNGILVNVFKFRSLIATIGVTTIAKSIGYIVGKGSPIYVRIDPNIEYIVYGKIAGFPILLLLVIALYAIASFLQNNSKLGQYLYALGENRQAALEAGIQEKVILYSFFVLSAVLAGAGGVLMVTMFTSGQPNFQGTYFVDGLTAVFLGALVIKTGKPNVVGTFIGAIFITVITNGLTLMGTPFYYGLIIKGGLMVLGVVMIAVTRSNQYKKWYANRERKRYNKTLQAQPTR